MINDFQILDHQNAMTCNEMYQVFQRSYQIEADLIGVKNFPPLKRTMDDMLNSPTSFYGIWRNKRLAAVIEIDRKEDSLDICSLVVDPDYFRQGLGGKLIDFILLTETPRCCVVETASVNKPAITLYQGRGFKEVIRWMTPYNIEKIKLEKVLE